MELNGYKLYTVSPFEAASNYTALITTTNTTIGTAMAKLNFASCTYGLLSTTTTCSAVNGPAISDHGFQVWAEGDILGHTPSIYIDDHSASRITFRGVKLAKGDTLKIVGKPDWTEPAPLDYVAVLPPGVVY